MKFTMQKLSGVVLSAVLSSLLPACGTSTTVGPETGGIGAEGGENPNPVEPRVLCVQTACGTVTQVSVIPDAENQLFTPDGRLFVSGGTNVFEISADGAGGFITTPIFAGACNFTGLAQRNNTLYAGCFDGQLYAATLNEAPVLNPIIDLNGVASPNGMAFDQAGRLYIVNGPTSTSGLPDPKILRLVFAPGNPLQVLVEEVWLAAGLEFPNGLKFEAPDSDSDDLGAILVADASVLGGNLGLVRRIPILANGAAGAAEIVATFNGVLDDLSLVDGQLLVSGFSNGQIHLIDASGALLQETDLAAFASPSSVQTG